jgi:hypothetical protein
MPTILRRLSTRLREHDWVAVLIELAIVVVGVVIGIEAANWNQSRQERLEERRYYAQLIEDLRADLNTLDLAIRQSKKHDRAAENVLSVLRSGSVPNGGASLFAVDVHYAGFLFLPRPARSTYDELISTGNLRLLRDRAAKDSIAAYYASFGQHRQWDDLLRQQQSDYWRMSAGVVPRRVLQAALRDRLPDVTAAEAIAILAAARQRPELDDLAIGMAAHQERVRRDSEFLKKLAQELIRQLEPLAR